MLKFKMLKMDFFLKMESFSLEIQSFLMPFLRKLTHFLGRLGKGNKAIEAHKSHGKDTGGDQGDGYAFHPFGSASEVHVFA